MKIYLISLTIINLMILGLSCYNLAETQKIKNDIGFIESKIDRLDIDTLEKIKKTEAFEVDCDSNEPGNWITSSICD